MARVLGAQETIWWQAGVEGDMSIINDAGSLPAASP
jgi:hypothetical protein